MTIKNSGYISNYFGPLPPKKTEQVSLQNSQQNSAKLNKVSLPARTDTIEISQKRVAGRPAFSEVRNQILDEISSDKDGAFLRELQEKVNSGAYRVDSAEIAKILISGK